METVISSHTSHCQCPALLLPNLCCVPAAGELLSRLCAVGRYTEDTAAELTRQMLGAIAHCHENSICHRDLKLGEHALLL